MTGRHRAAHPRARKSRRPESDDAAAPYAHATERSRRSWPLPVGLGLAAAALLGATVSITEGLTGDGEPTGAALAMTAPEKSSTSSAPKSSTSTTDKPTPSSTTSKPKPTPKPEPKPSTTAPPTTQKPPPPPPPPPTPEPEPCSTELEGTQPHVAQVGNHVLTKFDVDSVGGQASRSGASDHPSGLALDFMTTGASGDQIAEYILENQSEFGVTYVIWEQRYNDGGGWSYMEDRGSDTANHYDHVHVSFESSADVDVDC